MRVHKVLSVRLSEGETKLLEQMAGDKELTVSELVRLWLEQAARQAWREQQQGRGVWDVMHEHYRRAQVQIALLTVVEILALVVANMLLS
jgi:hypothetical protein